MIRNIREDSSESCVVTMKAISHCYWADRPQQLLDESAGAQVLLVREPDSVDPNAVRVHFRGQVAGYISSMDARQVAAAMDKAALTSLLGKVVGNATTPYFVLHIACDLIGIGDGTEEDKELNRVYEEWKYTGPLLPLSKSEKQLQGAVEYLGYVLAGLMPWDGQAKEYLGTFLKYHRQDHSDEMFRLRGALLRFLTEKAPDEAALLETELHEMSRHEYFDAIAAYVVALPELEAFHEMMVRAPEVDQQALSAELLAFPGNLVGMFKNDRKMFARRLHYVHPPRQALRRLFSGLALLQHMGQIRLTATSSAKEAGLNVDKLYNFGAINELS